jgi:ATP-grasp ribosomal peptide maturase
MGVDRQVLVLTCIDDPTSDVVINELNTHGVPVVRCDPADVLTGQLQLAARYGDGAATWLQTPTRGIDLQAVRSVYYRRPSPYKSPAALSDHDGRFAVDQARHGMGGVLANVQARWVNHIWRALEADFKPTQLAVAEKVGLLVPPTLVTNSLDEARAFAKVQPAVVYKPLHPSDLHAPDGRPEVIWVGEIDPDDLDEGITATLHLLQTRVNKSADGRTTVIGDQIYSVRIDSPHLDWRRDYEQVSYSIVETPDQVTEACRRYLERFGLLYGAFDFGIDAADGCWWWYECNTGGQWHWLELETGLPLTAAIADLLERDD